MLIHNTIGALFEGQREVNHATFYTQELGGKPAPNVTADLAARRRRERHLSLERTDTGEYWLNNITGPWNEYGVCKANIRNGLAPPLSGSCNNDIWK